MHVQRLTTNLREQWLFHANFNIAQKSNRSALLRVLVLPPSLHSLLPVPSAFLREGVKPLEILVMPPHDGKLCHSIFCIIGAHHPTSVLPEKGNKLKHRKSKHAEDSCRSPATSAKKSKPKTKIVSVWNLIPT